MQSTYFLRKFVCLVIGVCDGLALTDSKDSRAMVAWYFKRYNLSNRSYLRRKPTYLFAPK